MLYFLAVGFCWFLLIPFLSYLFHARHSLEATELLSETLLFGSAYGLAAIFSVTERRPLADYGLPLTRKAGSLFLRGSVLGLLEIGLLIGSIAALGGYSFGPVALRGPAILGWLLYWCVLFVLVGLAEEFAFRGYTQFSLAQAIGFWPAAAVLSLGFGAIHLGNPGEGWVGAASVSATGLLLAFTLRRTGNLWLAVGWHAAFDLGETFLFSVPNSGNVFEGHLSNASLRGPVWLTGGSVGPEGSVFCFAITGIMALAVHLLFPAAKQAASAAPHD